MMSLAWSTVPIVYDGVVFSSMELKSPPRNGSKGVEISVISR